jgi:hypothetical protein
MSIARLRRDQGCQPELLAPVSGPCVWLVHGRLRHPRLERSQGAARPAQLSGPVRRLAPHLGRPQVLMVWGTIGCVTLFFGVELLDIARDVARLQSAGAGGGTSSG